MGLMDNKISVIIPTLNRPDSLKYTIESYMSGTVIPHQFIIIDQSDDEQIRIANQQNLDEFTSKTSIEYIYQREKSNTLSRNRGIAKAKHDLLVFSDDDIEVESDTVENVLDIMNDETISMIGGLDSYAGKGKTNPLLSYIFAKKSYRKRNIGHVTRSVLGRFPEGSISDLVDTEWAMGFFFVVRKSLADKWDVRFDEKLSSYAYSEDLDFSHRYWHMSVDENLKCVMSNKVSVKHLASLEYRIPNARSTMMYVINREYFFYKHNALWNEYSRFLLSWSYVGDIIFRLIKKQNVALLCHAIKISKIHRNELKKLQLKAEWYDE